MLSECCLVTLCSILSLGQIWEITLTLSCRIFRDRSVTLVTEKFLGPRKESILMSIVADDLSSPLLASMEEIAEVLG